MSLVDVAICTDRRKRLAVGVRHGVRLFTSNRPFVPAVAAEPHQDHFVAVVDGQVY